MPEFLKLISLHDACQKLNSNLPQRYPGEEVIETLNSMGRILSQPVIAEEESPAFTRSSVDGFAVLSQDTNGASDSLPAYLHLIGEVEMGKQPAFQIKTGQAAIIHTGGMLPAGADAVIMMEFTQILDSTQVEILKPVASGENLLLKGEDVKKGDVVIPRGHLIRPQEIGGMLALGQTRVSVFHKPVVHIFSSGDEVISPEMKPQPGEVRDINSPMLATLIDACGGIPVMHPVIPDVPDKLEAAIQEVFDQADLIIITAGSSASTRDMTAEVINRFGTPGVLVHGINIRPGKPTILGVCNGKPMVGLPGNPVSALVIARLIVQPLLQSLSGGVEEVIEAKISAKLTINLASAAGRDDYLPVKVKQNDLSWIVEPIFFKSNLIFSLSRANGLLHIPADVTGYLAGDIVEVLLF